MSKEHNGWKNWATWNVALWLQNNLGLYLVTAERETYAQVVAELAGRSRYATPDGASYSDDDLDVPALDALVKGTK